MMTYANGDDGGGEDDEEKQPSCGDYVMHFITLFWKLLFAFVPPTELARGYVCFIVSIFVIGVVTAVIGDIASHFGCTLGIRDSVTAIVFVALGTSIPGVPRHEQRVRKMIECQMQPMDPVVTKLSHVAHARSQDESIISHLCLCLAIVDYS
uniref:Sodium/calcium exchanger membrane region domain-containing protein n=1 Tax=Timema cristinae TaxID=61476 RepID=A0A7R9CKT6_TIMCR|nr:unnamed protein product [Timema cristinae]